MALLLNIDSAFETCCIALSNNEEVISHEKNIIQKDHASFLQPAIKKVCSAASVSLSQVDAVAVSNGPGSYTGLRVGLSSAKGICFALNKPLILINTLDVMASALKMHHQYETDILFCPMIDARRNEVFTALYNSELILIKDYASVVLDETFLLAEKQFHRIAVGGNGSLKLKNLPAFGNILYEPILNTTSNLALLSYRSFQLKNFADLAYSEPFYIKPVYIR